MIYEFNGYKPVIHPSSFVHPAATVIGNVTLGNDASVWPGAVIRGDMHSISIGCRTSIQDNAVLHISHASDFNPEGWPLVIGDDVIVARWHNWQKLFDRNECRYHG